MRSATIIRAALTLVASTFLPQQSLSISCAELPLPRMGGVQVERGEASGSITLCVRKRQRRASSCPASASTAAAISASAASDAATARHLDPAQSVTHNLEAEIVRDVSFDFRVRLPKHCSLLVKVL